MSRLRSNEAIHTSASDHSISNRNESGLTLGSLLPNLDELDSALAAMGCASSANRIGKRLHNDVLACVQQNPPQERPASLLQTATEQIPAAARDELQSIINQQQLSQADINTLLTSGNRRNASLLIMRELAAIAPRDGADGLTGDRARRLQQVLQQMGADAAPAYFAVVDDASAPASLRQLAQAQITALRDRLGEGQTLQDLQGRTRRALGPNGNHFSADYTNGELTALALPHAQLVQVRPGVYRLTTERFGEQRTEEFSNASVQISTGPLVPGLQNQGDYLNVNLTVGGRTQFGTSLLLRAAQNR